MAGLSYDRPGEIPEGMRRLIEEQQRREAAKKKPQGEPTVFREGTGLPGEKKKPKRKYRNLPTERLLPNGECVRFASKKEALRFDVLSAEQRAGRIRELKMQYEILIQPAYTDGETGERYRGVRYLADFVYERLEDGKWVRHVEDTKGGGRKGTATQSYQIKRKLIADKGIHIEEV